MSDLLCLKCGKRKRYERNGRVFNLCAVCAWNDLQALFYTEGDTMNCVICGEDCHGDYCRDCQIDVEIQECGSYFIGDEDEDAAEQCVQLTDGGLPDSDGDSAPNANTVSLK